MQCNCTIIEKNSLGIKNLQRTYLGYSLFPRQFFCHSRCPGHPQEIVSFVCTARRKISKVCHNITYYQQKTLIRECRLEGKSYLWRGF